MQDFTRGLAEVGAQVYGVGELPKAALPAKVQRHLRDYLQIPSLFDEDAGGAPHRPGRPADPPRPRRVPVGSPASCSRRACARSSACRA